MALDTEVDQLWSEAIEEKTKGWLEAYKKLSQRARSNKGYFHQRKPLYCYASLSADLSRLSVRFKGQEVAELKISNKENSPVRLCWSKKHVETNQRDFGNGFAELFPSERSCSWDGSSGQSFRHYFRELATFKVHSPEHEVKDKIIREMMSQDKNTKFGGRLSGIRPVLLADKFPLEFPLPISGCQGTPKLGKGNMDILARRRAGRTRLSLWELKKPGPHNKDILRKAFRQCYIYAATLRRMLRSDHGIDWYHAFGFTQNIPASLHLDVVVAVSLENKDTALQVFKEESTDMPSTVKGDKLHFFLALYRDVQGQQSIDCDLLSLESK